MLPDSLVTMVLPTMLLGQKAEIPKDLFENTVLPAAVPKGTKIPYPPFKEETLPVATPLLASSKIPSPRFPTAVQSRTVTAIIPKAPLWVAALSITLPATHIPPPALPPAVTLSTKLPSPVMKIP